MVSNCFSSLAREKSGINANLWSDSRRSTRQLLLWHTPYIVHSFAHLHEVVVTEPEIGRFTVWAIEKDGAIAINVSQPQNPKRST
ncbi:MAG TPA: hypothetical protein IGS37_00915 [Synechococcales cyanobacterium M55_K2018_004]|nr:hypothetical protein [Synechococcales cyanobacterium M55_K2018_004]